LRQLAFNLKQPVMNDPSPEYLYNKPNPKNTYDAIVIGSGISGGWAARELCEKGLKTLVLERGRNVEHKRLPHRHDAALGF